MTRVAQRGAAVDLGTAVAGGVEPTMGSRSPEIRVLIREQSEGQPSLGYEGCLL
jgi:hypothetical protein